MVMETQLAARTEVPSFLVPSVGVSNFVETSSVDRRMGNRGWGACHHRRYCPSKRYSMFLAPAADGSPSGVLFDVAKLGVTPAWAPACECSK
jgi:hypothetical protein